MNKSTITAAIAAAAVLVGVASAPAQAKEAASFDRSAFDATPVTTSSGWTISAATAGELGGWLDMTVAAVDGAPPSSGSCEPARDEAVLTVAPGESFTISTTAELCAHVVDGSPSLFGSFDARQVAYSGARKKAKVDGGFVGFGSGFLGAQGSVSLTVRW
jgi:hypothetical protein